jgi:hypothetical protein
MGKLIIRKLALGFILSIGFTNPLRLDLDIHLDLSGEELENVGTKKTLKKPLNPKAADLYFVDLPYKRQDVSSPISVSFSDLSYTLLSTDIV